MNRTILAALAALAIVLLAACGPTYTPGPNGTVTDRGRSYTKAVGWRYTLTTTKKFRVPRADYRACVRGSTYPACTTRGDS